MSYVFPNTLAAALASSQRRFIPSDILALKNIGIFFAASYISAICASPSPVVAITAGVFDSTAYSSRPGTAEGEEKSIMTSALPLKLNGETKAGYSFLHVSLSIPATILTSSRPSAKAVTVLPMLPQQPLRIILSIRSPCGVLPRLSCYIILSSERLLLSLSLAEGHISVSGSLHAPTSMPSIFIASFTGMGFTSENRLLQRFKYFS